MPVAHGAPELFQIGRRVAALRDSGGLRVEQDASAEYSVKCRVKRRRFNFGGVGARYRDESKP
jgi:hypothetical protein